MAIIFDTVFDDDFAAFTPPVPNASFAKAGYGCSAGHLFVCGSTIASKWLVTPDDVSLPTLHSALTVRVLGAAHTDTGTIPNVMSGVNAIMGGVKLLGFSAPVNTAGSLPSTSFTGFVNLKTGGALQIFISDDRHSDGGVVFETAAGAFPVDGTHHGLQVLLNFVSANQLDFSLVVDNAVVLTNSYTTQNISHRNWSSDFFTPGTYQDYAGVGAVDLQIYKDTVTGNDFYDGWSRMQIEDAAVNASWGACSGATELDDDFSICTSSPPPPPSPPTDLPLSTPCCGKEPGEPSVGPKLPPVSPVWTPACAGGGLVPLQARLRLTETWDV